MAENRCRLKLLSALKKYSCRTLMCVYLSKAMQWNLKDFRFGLKPFDKNVQHDLQIWSANICLHWKHIFVCPWENIMFALERYIYYDILHIFVSNWDFDPALLIMSVIDFDNAQCIVGLCWSQETNYIQYLIFSNSHWIWFSVKSFCFYMRVISWSPFQILEDKIKYAQPLAAFNFPTSKKLFVKGQIFVNRAFCVGGLNWTRKWGKPYSFFSGVV